MQPLMYAKESGVGLWEGPNGGSEDEDVDVDVDEREHD
jgi:hypothetical protein